VPYPSVRVHGYVQSRASTLDQLDESYIERELSIREITCEIPGCKQNAVFVLPSGVTALVCASHKEAWNKSPAIQKALESAVTIWLKGQMSLTVSAAFEDAENHVTFSYDAEQSLLEQARKVIAGANSLLASVERREAAVLPVSLTLKPNAVRVQSSKERPTLATLDSNNAEPLLFDLFII
jgi:hypothetical protein